MAAAAKPMSREWTMGCVLRGGAVSRAVLSRLPRQRPRVKRWVGGGAWELPDAWAEVGRFWAGPLPGPHASRPWH